MKINILKKKVFSSVFLGTALFAISCNITKEEVIETDFAKYVDQYIGTGGHGHVFMGANVPFGFVQLGPTSIPQSWDWTSGYHISDTTVIGFSHLHLNGTGIGDLSDIVLMPVVGDVNHNRGTHDSYDTGMWSYFSRVNEQCAPGYYATRLDRYNIDVELTATQRVGLHKYAFTEGTKDGRIVIDLENGTCWDESVENKLIVLNDSTVAGYRYSKGWANDQRVYFVAEFSKPFEKFQLFDKNTVKDGKELISKQVYGEAIYGEIGTDPIYVKVALSPVSIDNAQLNMKAELAGWDFEKVKSDAYNAWNAELAKIKIKTSDESIKRIFYTGLYHTMIAPSVFGDVNGDYRGADGNHHIGGSFTNYTTFSLWDTYRAAHPLMTIIHPEKMPDMMNTMLNIYKQQGKLPVWHLMGCETDCMVGNPGIPVVADAILKGFDGFDHELAFEAMKASAMKDDRGMNFRKEFGYIPYDKMLESVAYDMEYALADWTVAQVAKKLGKEEDYQFFEKRSKSYKNFFDPATGFMRGKGVKGEFRTPFSPFASSHREDDYCEGNAWQYTFLVPHDLDGLIECYGSKDAFIQKLDSLFIVDSKLEGDITSPDISGLIGQYAHGNEPSHHILYFYTMVGQPWKGADLIRRVLSELYHDQPDGLSGNEDVGQMSAWYILSSMGMYQPEPAGGRYYFGSPIVDEAVLNVGNGKEFTIVAQNNSKENKYIQSVKLNGEAYTLPYITFEDIQKGGKLEFVMGTGQVAWSK